MAMTGQVIPLPDGKTSAVQNEIVSYLNARQLARSALQDLADENAKSDADMARTVALKPLPAGTKLADYVWNLYGPAQAKLELAKNQRKALEHLFNAVQLRLTELARASREDYVAVLREKIAAQKKTTDKTQDDAERAEIALKELNAELAAIVHAHPHAASSASAPGTSLLKASRIAGGKLAAPAAATLPPSAPLTSAVSADTPAPIASPPASPTSKVAPTFPPKSRGGRTSRRKKNGRSSRRKSR